MFRVRVTASLLRGDITKFDVPTLVIIWFWASFVVRLLRKSVIMTRDNAES